MKYLASIALLLFLFAGFGLPNDGRADNGKSVNEGTEKAAVDKKEGAAQAGKSTGAFGKGVKEGAKKTWSDVKKSATQTGKVFKEGTVEVGRDIKKAYQKTSAVIKKKINGDSDIESKGEQEKPTPPDNISE